MMFKILKGGNTIYKRYFSSSKSKKQKQRERFNKTKNERK